MNSSRIEDLRAYVKQWDAALAALVGQRASLLDMQAKGYRLSDDQGDDYLQRRILFVDKAVLEHQDILARMQTLLGRALAGEDL